MKITVDDVLGLKVEVRDAEGNLQEEVFEIDLHNKFALRYPAGRSR